MKIFIVFNFSNIPLFYGNTANAKDFIRITKYLKENGYITGFAKDYCLKDCTRSYYNFT